MKLLETGEMGQHDIEKNGEWYEAAQTLKTAARHIQKLTKGALTFTEVRPFDVYQGPYAQCKLFGRWARLWFSTPGEDEFYLETHIRPLDPDEDITGDVYTIARRIKEFKESKQTDGSKLLTESVSVNKISIEELSNRIGEEIMPEDLVDFWDETIYDDKPENIKKQKLQVDLTNGGSIYEIKDMAYWNAFVLVAKYGEPVAVQSQVIGLDEAQKIMLDELQENLIKYATEEEVNFLKEYAAKKSNIGIPRPKGEEKYCAKCKKKLKHGDAKGGICGVCASNEHLDKEN